MVCDGCNQEFNEDEGRVDSGGTFYCTTCYNEEYGSCTYCDAEVRCDNAFFDEGYVCDNCRDSNYTSCACCSDLTYTHSMHDTNDGKVCGVCYNDNYYTCNDCNDVVHSEDWCYDCGSCADCCSCGDCCAEVSEEYPPTPADTVGGFGSIPQPLQAYSDVYSNNAYPNNPITQHDVGVRVSPSEPILTSRPVRGASTGMPALIQTLDNTAFRLCDENIESVLGMLDKTKKITVGDITGRYCTANGSYFKLERIVAEVGKVSKPRYFYGLRSNKYDIVLGHSTRAIVNELTSLGLTYHLRDGDRHKVGLSFALRKRKYDKCVTFLKFLCTQ